jgi:hypothetical protein
VRVDVSRRGGLTGGRPLKGTLDTSQFHAKDAAAVEDALRTLPFGRAAPPPPSRPDLMRYDLTVVDADGHAQRAEVNEDELPDELRRLIDPTLHVDTSA